MIIEDKTKAAAFGAGAAGTVVAFVVWLLAQAFWHGRVDLVPEQVVALATLVIPAAGAFLGGYVARHTPRPDLQPAVEIADDGDSP